MMPFKYLTIRRQLSMKKKLILLLLILVFIFTGCSQLLQPDQSIDITDPEITSPNEAETSPEDSISLIDEDGEYTSTEDVALYLNTFQKLPSNYITKNEARDLGWVSSEGNLWEVTDNKSIGGDKFGNREGLLPKETGRIYYECDVNYNGGFRGGERIVFSNDGLIFYTDDHYNSFDQLY